MNATPFELIKPNTKGGGSHGQSNERAELANERSRNGRFRKTELARSGGAAGKGDLQAADAVPLIIRIARLLEIPARL
jgi:hypothetical protein